MPSPLLQLRIPQDLFDWLEAKHPSRGEVAEYVRQLLTAEQMKEAVAPLVPGIGWTEEAKDFLEEGFKAEPKPKARPPKLSKEARAKRSTGSPIDLLEAKSGTNELILPARCNRGACTGTIKPNGHCMICAQKPLHQSGA